MPRLTEETKAARRTAIIEAATACFVEKGYGGTSMADIIKKSGMSSGSIYSHFGSKEEILRGAVEVNIDFMTSRVRAAATAQEAPSPRVLVSAVTYKGLPNANPGLMVKFWAEAAAETEIKKTVQGVVTHMRDLFAGELAAWADIHAPAGVSSRDFALVAADKIMLVIHGFALRISIDSTLDPDAFLQQMITMLPD